MIAGAFYNGRGMPRRKGACAGLRKVHKRFPGEAACELRPLKKKKSAEQTKRVLFQEKRAACTKHEPVEACQPRDL